MSLAGKTLSILKRHNLLQPGDRVLAGVSGGADSLALLHILHRLRRKLGYDLHAATFDHRLRGAASAADAAYVAQLCALWKIPVTVGQWSSPVQGAGVEERARIARYAFLAQTAREQGAQIVAVAHHAGDQTETVLMHLLRGAGLRGLGGMRRRAPMPSHPDLTLIRPLLSITRAEIDAYCLDHALQPRHDPTNLDTTLLRNRLRHDIIPLLELLVPHLTERLGQLAETAQIDNDFIEQAVQQIFEAHVSTAQTEPPQIAIPRAVFAALHPAQQRRLIVRAAEQVGRRDAETGSKHIRAALDVALHSEVGAVAQLPGGRQLRVDYTALIIETAGRNSASAAMPLLHLAGEITVPLPGETLFDGWLLHTSLEALPGEQGRIAIQLGASAALRTRRAGDRFAPLGMGGHTRKLSRWMIDRKIPQHLRDYIPLLTVDGHIAAVMTGGQWTVDEKFAVRAASDRIIIHLKCSRIVNR